MHQTEDSQNLLGKYLAALGISATPTPEPNFENLKTIAERHAVLINYQNYSIFKTKDVLPFSNEALFDRLVERRLGGMCFEITELIAHFLEVLGFQVFRVATVTTNNLPYDPATLKTHVILVVPIGQDYYLVDVGYGYNQIRTPLKVSFTQTEEFVTNVNEKYQVFCGDTYYEMKIEIKDEWWTCYRFNKQTDKPFPETITREQSVGYYEAFQTSDTVVVIRDLHMKLGKLTEKGRVAYIYNSVDQTFTKTIFEMGVQHSRKHFTNYKEFIEDVREEMHLDPLEECFLKN